MCPRLVGYTNNQRSDWYGVGPRPTLGEIMSQDTERIRVGEEAESGDAVEMPVIDVLAGRGFITGKSGSGKSNTASVVAEQLLEAGYGLLIVDVDGEYYGLKEEYELLHAGADEECDIRVSPEHAEKLATLALEENVPIILDVSSYLDPADADEMLLAVARQLFAKAKKQKKPFLVLVEECHEYIPEGGGMTETGKMLIKIGKRGRKHGLGIVGMSQRPADVKKDFITQCDWMVWHRLTWDNDTRVVGRILGNEYADLVEGLNDGEAFLVSDWVDAVRRVQFDRKRTFDAGATPGLEEFERPDLQSVSDDLVADLQQVSEERQRHESTVDSLEAALQEREQRIEELEAELTEARDMSEMADRFAQALVDNAKESPTESTPAESEVAEAEEFVSEAARDGYPGSASAPESPSLDNGTEIDAGTELLPENQRDLHAYAMNDGGQAHPQAETDGSGERQADGEEPECEPDSEQETLADEDGSDSSEDSSQTESDEQSSDTDSAPSKETPSGLQPVKTISSREEKTEGADSDTEAAVDATEDTDADAEDGEDASAGAAEPEPEDPEQDHDTEPSSEAPDSGTADSTADESGDTGSVERPDTTRIESELEPEPESESPTAESAAGSEPLEATGDWPTPEGTQPSHESEPGEADPDLNPERTAELKKQLSDEFGVQMEASSDLTGGSLGSSTSDSEPAPDDARGDSPAEELEDASEQAEASDSPPPEADSTDSPAVELDGESSRVDPTADRGERLTELVEETELFDEEEVVQVFVHGIEALDDVTRGMLEHYRTDGKLTPVDAHVAAGGSGERQYAYARNRTLRTAGLVEHAGAGRYRYRLPDLVSEVFAGTVDEETVADTVRAIESAAGIADE